MRLVPADGRDGQTNGFLRPDIAPAARESEPERASDDDEEDCCVEWSVIDEAIRRDLIRRDLIKRGGQPFGHLVLVKS